MISMADKKIVTHNGEFHADEVFAIAALTLTLKESYEIIRTREDDLVKTADYVIDVGRKYDPDKNHFDHHQENSVGNRENGVPYASFGLVWKKFGEKACGSKEVADLVDEVLVQSIDLADCGIDMCNMNFENAPSYSISNLVMLYRPIPTNGDVDMDSAFMEALSFAQFTLRRMLSVFKYELSSKDDIKKYYEESEDKRILVLPKELPWDLVVTRFYPDILYVVYPENNQWEVKAPTKGPYTFESRKKIPEGWAGKAGKELIDETKVNNAKFCHTGRFFCSASSREAAMALARLAVDN
jgi:uncharacterized UPF0160 family protein